MSELLPDEHNANKGTARGTAAIENSLQRNGAGRSILLDKNLRIIAGNKTQGKFGEIGGEEVILVHTTGHQLVAVVRDDLDLETDAQARELAYADNRTSELDLIWDAAQLAADLEAGTIDLSGMFRDDELERLTASLGLEFTGGLAGDDDPLYGGGEPGGLAPSHVRMVQLFFTTETQPEFLRLVEALALEFSTSNPTDTVMAVLRWAYETRVMDPTSL